jgi:hypothetical protein
LLTAGEILPARRDFPPGRARERRGTLAIMSSFIVRALAVIWGLITFMTLG